MGCELEPRAGANVQHITWIQLLGLVLPAYGRS
jgi:hypothetical protein